MSSFRKKSVFALKWAFISQIVNQLLQFVSAIILARILAPEDFGIVAIVGVFTSFALILNDFGFSNAIIQKKELSKKEIDTVFWFNIFIGLTLFLLFYFILNIIIADFFNDSRLIKVTKIISFVFIINALSAMPGTLLIKDLKFKENGIILIIAFIISTIITIILALKGYAYLSLAYRSVINSAINSLLIIILVRYFPTNKFHWVYLKRFMSFGLNLMANRSITYWIRNFDNFLIGKLLGQYELGIYNRSYRIMMYPLNNVSNVIKRVMFPAFSSIQDNLNKIKQIYLKITQTIAFITFPLIMLIFMLSHEFVFVLLGEKWMGMAPVLKLLVLVALPQVILTLNGTIYLTIGKPHIPFRLNIIQGIILFISFYVGIKLNGLTGLIIGYLVVNVIFFYPVFYFAAREIGLSFREQVKNLKWVVINSLIIGLLVYLANKTLYTYGEYIRFFSLTTLATIIYLVLSYFKKEKIFLMQEVLKKIRNK